MTIRFRNFLTSGFAWLCVLLCALPSFGGTVTGVVQSPAGGPLRNATFTFQLTQAATVSGTALIAPITVSCYTDGNGNVVGEPNPLVAPVLTTNTSSGTLASGTYYVVLAYFDATGATIASPETSINLSSTGTVVVNAPVTQPTGASGYEVFIGTAPGAETLQGTVTGTPGGWGQFSQSTALSAGTALPSSNTTQCKLRFNDELQPSFTCYDVGLRLGSFTVPNYPQYWYLAGGSAGTVNVGTGTPQSTVCQGAGISYPQSIVTTPPGNATQSINGGLNLNGFPLVDFTADLFNINNRLYIDGTEYAQTQAGVQQALNDSCSLGNGNGTEIELPAAGTITLSTFISGALLTSTCPVHFHSPTMGSFWFVVAAGVPSTVPTLLIKPSGANLGYWELDHFRGTTAASGQTGGDWIFLDTTNGDVSNLIVHDSSFQGQCKAGGSASCDPSNSAWFINMNTAGGANHVFLGDIENNNTIEGGINCNGECSDSWRIVHNSFGSPNGNTNPCVNGTTFNNGTAMMTLENNNGGCKGGFFVSHGTTQCLITKNQIEQPAAPQGCVGAACNSTEPNSAIIDLQGDTYSISDCKIRDNNIGSNNLANINVRVDHATGTVFSGDVIGVNTTGGTGIALTGNSSGTAMDVNNSNKFVLGGSAAAMTNASGLNPWTITLYTSTGTLPATCKNDSAGGIQCITNGGKSWDFQNTSNLVTPVGVGINYSGATSGATIDATQAVAGGTFTRLAMNSGSVVKLFVTSDFTTTSASLATITGLTFTQLANPTNYNFHCELAYSQATAAAADAFGIQVATNSPTNVFSTGKVWTSATAMTTATLESSSTGTAATNIVTFTPSVSATIFVAELSGTVELPASANTVNFMALTGNASDALTIKRGSYCEVW